MDIFLDSPDVLVDDLPLLNYVRYYTESTTLAEITTSDGKRIRPEVFHPEQFIEKDTMWHRHEPSTWTRHGNVDTATHRLWKASLIATVCNYDGMLHKPLGKWLVKNKQWQHWFVKDALYIQYDHGWKKHQVISKSRTKITYTRKSEHVTSKPEGGNPITDVRLCKQHMESTPPMETHIKLGDTIWVVTDGGLKRGDGYFVWVITTDTNILWEGHGYIQGNDKLAESLRTEGMSHMATAMFMKHYNWYHNITIQPQTTKHFTDNQGIVKRIKWFQTRCIKTPSDCLAPDYDIQSHVEAIYEDMEWDWETEWVKGHQEEAIPFEDLTWEEQLNVRADELAMMARSEITNKDCREKFDIFPACHAQLFIKNKPITRKLKATIQDKWSAVELRKDCKKRFGWKSQEFDLIQWSESGQNFATQIFITDDSSHGTPMKDYQ
eukprot:4155353-Ditylum_brightwellii.AAC.2